MTKGMRSLLTGSCLVVMLAAPEFAPAQQKSTAVPRRESPVLLDMPGLERGVEQFHYFGWDARFASETSLAFASAAANGYPAAAAVRQQLAKGFVWRASSLNEDWIRQTAFPLKDKPIQITRPGRVGSDGYLNTVLFSSGDLKCAGFDFRHYAKGIVETGIGDVGYRGFYCGAPGAKVGEEDIARIVGGVFVRAKGEIRRAYELDVSPVPDRVKR